MVLKKRARGRPESGTAPAGLYDLVARRRIAGRVDGPAEIPIVVGIFDGPDKGNRIKEAIVRDSGHRDIRLIETRHDARSDPVEREAGQRIGRIRFDIGQICGDVRNGEWVCIVDNLNRVVEQV